MSDGRYGVANQARSFVRLNFLEIIMPNTEESQWLAQFSSMREAVAKMRLGQSNGVSKGYGHDVVIDDAGLTRLGSDDIWNVFGDYDNEYEDSSYFSDYSEVSESKKPREYSGFNLDWLRGKCSALAIYGHSNLDASQLEDQLLALLASNMQSTDPA